MPNPLLEAALKYLDMGMSVIPLLPGTKDQPLVKWADYQDKKATREDIELWWKKTPTANVAIITGEISGICVVDHDSYKPKYSEEIALQYFSEVIITPTSMSPRTGTHMYFEWPGQKISGKPEMGGLPAIDFRCDGNYIVAPPSVNGNSKPYSWLLELGQTPLMRLPDAYIEIISTSSIYKNSFYKGGCSELGNENATSNYIDYKILQQGSRDEDLFHIANCLIKGNCDPKFAYHVLEILAHNSNPPFPEKEIITKIESALNRAERRERNLADEVREWCLLQEGYFLTTDILQTLQITTKDEKKNLTVILTRLKGEGIIEPYGEKRGSYRLVHRETAQMQFIEAPVDEFNVKLSFGINDVCKIFPKNIIIVAGTKSSGKTALLMKWALDNQDRYPVVYLNSEMGDEEYSERLKSFGIKQASDIKMSSYNCHKNFHDFISDEQKIFIIDFMEVHDDFAQIASYIRKVHEKLRQGICIIAVQKKVGAAFGRGAEFSMEKSRLYINLDFLQDESCTKLTLTDVKTPRYNLGYDHPRGKYKRIKILGGSKMTSLDADWRS